MRKRSVPRWSTQPGTDALETRALLSTLVIVERQLDAHPAPGETAPDVHWTPGDPGMPAFLLQASMHPRGPMGPGGHGPGDDRPAFWRGDDRAMPSSPPPFRPSPGMKSFGFRMASASADTGQQVASYFTAKASPSGAASKSGNASPGGPDNGPSNLIGGPQITLSKGSLSENPVRIAIAPQHGFGVPERHEVARDEVLRPMFGIPVVLADTGPKATEAVTVTLSGVASVDDASPSNANPLTVPLSLYRINGPSNYLLPPPTAVRDANGLVPVRRVSGISEAEPTPVVVIRDGNGPGAVSPADPSRPGDGEPAEAPIGVNLEGLPITPEVEPEAAQLGIGLITDWLFKDPAIGDGLASAGSDVEDVIRGQSFLSVAAVIGGLTAVEVGRRIVRRWMTEDVESEVELDDQWIDGELLREWSGRMSPRFS